jgi:hypothetical protein
VPDADCKAASVALAFPVMIPLIRLLDWLAMLWEVAADFGEFRTQKRHYDADGIRQQAYCEILSACDDGLHQAVWWLACIVIEGAATAWSYVPHMNCF